MLAQLPSSLLPLLLTSLSALPLAAAQDDDRKPIVNTFTGYPSNIRQCLVNADRCENIFTHPEMNKCLCSDTDGFVSDTARCVYATSPDDVESVLQSLVANCNASNTPIKITNEEFIAIAETGKESDGLGVSSKDKPTNTDSSKPDATDTPDGKDEDEKSDDKEDEGGLSQGATIGIAVGSTAVAVAIIAAVLFYFLRRRGKNDLNRHSLAPLTGRESSAYQPVSVYGEYKGTTDGGYPTAANTPHTHQGPHSPPAWGPESFIAAGGNISPPPTTGGQLSPQHSQLWSDPSRPNSWNPHASWGSPAQAYQPVATGDVAGLPPPPAQLAPMNTLYELPSSPRAGPGQGPAEMPASPHNPHA